MMKIITEPCPSCAELRVKVAELDRQVEVLCASWPDQACRDCHANVECDYRITTCGQVIRKWSAAKAKEASNV